MAYKPLVILCMNKLAKEAIDRDTIWNKTKMGWFLPMWLNFGVACNMFEKILE